MEHPTTQRKARRDGCNCDEAFGVGMNAGERVLRCIHVDGRSLALIETPDIFCVQQLGGPRNFDPDRYSPYLDVATAAFERAEAEWLALPVRS